MAAAGEDLSDDGGEEYEEIVYPSGKLGAVTRKKNEITELMKVKSAENVAKIGDSHKSLLEKIKNFNSACMNEMTKNVPTEDKNEFENWFKKHSKTNSSFIKKITAWLLEPDSDEESDVESKYDDTNDGADLRNMMKVMMQSQVLSQLPRNEPDYFSGEDITAYRSFILSFERIIEQRCISHEDKFYYLLKYTKGEANNLVKSCHESDMRNGYQEARKLLERQYGNEYRIAQRYQDKLHNWEQIKSEDSNGLRKLAAFLTECNNMMSRMSAMNQLNSLRDIREIVMKLPFDLRKQFRNKTRLLMSKNEEINFNTLVSFVNEQSDLLQVPILGDISDRTLIDRKPKGSVQRTYYTNEAEDPKPEECLCCKKQNHLLEDCFFFKKKPMKDREEMIRKLRLCFGCLKPGHRSKDCKQKLKCKSCGKFHPTALHRNTTEQPKTTYAPRVETEVQPEPAERSLNMVTRENLKIVCPAIPVMLRATDTGEIVTTYMGIDNYSTASYIDLKIIRKLNTKTEESSLSVTTIENNSSNIKVSIARNLEIMSLNGDVIRRIAKVYGKSNWTFKLEDSPKSSDLVKFPELEKLPFQFINSEIGILIGMDQPEMLKPLQIAETTKYGPYASRHIFGWALNGPIKGSTSTEHCLRTKAIMNDDLDVKFEKAFGKDFEDNNEASQYSVDEIKWLNTTNENTIKRSDNHFEISLPFQSDKNIPNNYYQVLSRLKSLQKRLAVDDKYRKDYSDFMKTMRDRNFAEKVPDDEQFLEGQQCWFLTHHGVYHKQKEKLRVVFDCSLKCKGTSLNDKLWKGPDLNNTLVGVLMRFRLEPYAVCGDIEKMFYMVGLPVEDRNYLRFLWFENDDTNANPVQFRMTVHLFGASSSPAIANFALKKSVEDEENTDVKNTVIDSFYVDDMMKSFPSEQQAISTIENIQSTLHNSGFNLTSFSSNSRNVLATLPKEKLSKQLSEIKFEEDDLPYERTLGIKWNVENDSLGFNVKLPDQPATKRGILSTVFSVYDPLFLASPALIRAKRLFQIACDKKLAWDDPLPPPYQRLWQDWRDNIHWLNNFEIPRCYKLNMKCNENANVQLHLFADGSEIAYGAVAYLRYETNHYVNTAIVMAKARLTPISRNSLKTIPRIELNAAKIAVQLYEKVSMELKNYLCINNSFFWTDSVAALQYIKSNTGHFQRFVANRVAYIKNTTNDDMWRFVPGELNPADLLSRGTKNLQEFTTNSVWKYGPEFLRRHEQYWPNANVPTLENNDPELKKSVVMTTKANIDTMDELMNSCSNLFKLKRRIAILLKFKSYLLKTPNFCKKISVDDITLAECSIWKYTQNKHFLEEINCVKDEKQLSNNNKLVKLSPFVDDSHLLRVGGRLSNSPLPFDARHPIILSAQSLPVKLLVEQIHKSLGHLGREAVCTAIREKFHIVGGNKLVRQTVRNCLICRKVQGKVSTQVMAELPEDRVESDLQPFTCTATDLFGPFYVSKGRGKAQEKRYGILFSCLKSRASHLEVTSGLDTDSYINAVRRFISRRGTPKLMRSDNGTNLVATNKELRDSIRQWNQDDIGKFCQQREIEWKFQPPHASHFGGVFERTIRVIRKLLDSLLREFTNQVKITDCLLLTLFCEIENMLNSRPLTNVTSDAADSLPLTPNHLLRLQTVVSFPTGIFHKDDLYYKRRWRQAQFLADVFWRRWQREYLPLLIERQKWTKQQRSHQIGDLVLVSDQLLPRSMWCTEKIVNVNKDKYGNVRSANIEVLRHKQGNNLILDKTVITRPVVKLILLRCFDEL